MFDDVPFADEPVRCPFQFDIGGVAAPSGDAVFLYGELRAQPGTERSLLLRSEDGLNWREVMAPVPGSEVQEMSFVSPERGWVLVAWTVEGPGEVTVRATDDGGRSWRPVAEVPKPHRLDSPVFFQCVAPRRCTLRLGCAESNSPRQHVLESKDGGHSWSRRRSAPSTQSDTRPALTATSPDGTEWHLTRVADDKGHTIAYDILKRDAAHEWMAVSRISRDYELEESRPRACVW
jgi:photosystem II stability/assembly factor-like uncharacterized protein